MCFTCSVKFIHLHTFIQIAQYMDNEPLHQATAQEARTQLSDLINRAVYARQPSLITRQGKPVAVLVSYEEWIQMKERSDQTGEIGQDDLSATGGAVD